MATYIELFNLRNDSDLRNRTAMAVVVAAEAIRNEPTTTANHANRLAWAKRVFENPAQQGAAMLWALLAANKGASVAAITGATDGALQTRVDAAVDVFAVAQV